MKNKKIMIMVIGILAFFTLLSFAETKKLKQIGRYTLVRIKGEVPTSEVMKTLIEKYAGDIKYGFDLTGYGDLFLPFLDQLKKASFSEREIAVGDKFIWMLFRSRGRVKVAENLEWAGKKPLPVFSFSVKKDYKTYEFVMPKPCGNISLVKVEEVIPEAICDIKVSPSKANINDPITVDMSGSQHAQSMEVGVLAADGSKIEAQKLTPDSPRWQTKFAKPGEYVFKAKAFNPENKASTNPCEAKAYINAPPICKLWTSCLPCQDYVGRPITIDASQSTDPDGQVVKAEFEIRDAAGTVIDTYSDSEKPFAWEKIFAKPGLYTITAIVTDDFGATSEPCKLEFEITQKKLFFMVEGGPLLARGSTGPYLDAALGLSYWLVPDTLDFTLAGGGSLALKGDPWKSFFLMKGLLNVHASSAFFGVGLGFNSQVRENRDQSDVLLIGAIGYDLYDRWTSRGSVFFEAQSPLGSGRSFSKHHKLILGFRFLF